MQCFSSAYAEARLKFVDACGSLGWRHAAQENASATGPCGERLYCDVAYRGPAGAKKIAVVLSGVHGQEGYCGSAIQLNWMHRNSSRVASKDVAMLFVHAVNPWGMAHFSRTTENNVDLNRNFVDYSALPGNPIYEALHDAVCSSDWTAEGERRFKALIRKYESELDENALWGGLIGGQYTHPNGLIYGGRRREWSSEMLATVLREFASDAQVIGVIDLHSGVGDRAQPFFLCFHPDGSDERGIARSWWPDYVPTGTDSRTRDFYQGLLIRGLQEQMRPAKIVGAVVEFGTRPPEEMFRMLRLDRWLRFGRSAEQPTADHYADMFDAFCPIDPEWRASVLEKSEAIISAMIEGLTQIHQS